MGATHFDAELPRPVGRFLVEVCACSDLPLDQAAKQPLHA